MTKELFEEIILKLQLMHEKGRKLYDLGIDLLEYTEPYERVIDVLLKAHFNDDQIGWIDWYLYERPSLTGKGKPNKAYKTVGKKKVEICHTIDSLWETIQEYNPQAEWCWNIPEYTPQAEWDKRWPGRKKVV